MGIRSDLEGKSILYLLLHWSKSKRPSAPYLKRRSTKVHTGTKSRTRSFLEDVQYPAMLMYMEGPIHGYFSRRCHGPQPPDFGRSANPIQTKGGADYGHHITTFPPPDCQTFLRPCTMVSPLPFSAASDRLNFLVSTFLQP